MDCHACAHHEDAPFAFCPNCGTRPLPPADKAGEAKAANWAADPRIANDHRSTMAMGSVDLPLAGFPEPAAPVKTGAGNAMFVVIGIAVLAGLGVAAYFLANF